jgi:hypothetical protein
VLRRFTAAASDIVAEHQGWIARGDAARLVALFEEGPKADRPHATRAIEAALQTVLAARQVKKADGPGAHAPAFPDLSVGCGVHTGEVLIARFPGAGHLSLTLAGPTVDLAQRLDGRAKGLGWSIAVSQSAAAGAGGRFQLGRRASLTDADHAVSLAISEVVGFNAGFARPGELTRMAEVREAVLANSMLARLASDIDQFSADKTIMVRAERTSRPDERLPDLPERRVTRRIGGGRYVGTYLTVHLPTGRDEVVKLARPSDTTPAFVAGYLREYRRVASLQQRNIVGVYEAGELAGDGFVALEFLPGGHLLDAIRGTLSIGQSLRCLAEICFALDAIHAVGLAHGGLRAEHLMFRAGGVLVLADFNVSERVAESVGLAPARAAGVGTAQFGDLAVRADFRSAGRMLHAMLTGDLALVQPVPEVWSEERLRQATRLPLALSQLQPCLDGLLGVGGGEPWRRAEDVLVELLALKDVFPFDIRESLPARQGAPNPPKALSRR